eukprot:CAMPEP_0174877646 /NCGR_PEP_ID=MMETSP1114-20130205/82260_1 /TAXON_ID=312471 /ORGANISM="Neobodo designis, Strain CCAP 1951/1" /LENGTH=179 /DNA_ID=CAMNT_0016113029 /DNA_START=48 /DNA_END=583 /DNA_ORIENTATION=+
MAARDDEPLPEQQQHQHHEAGDPQPVAYDDDPEVAAVRSLFPDVPEALEFESWWNERGGLKRYMSIVFIPAVGQFHVQVDDSKVPLTVAISDRRGRPLQAWDLYVGATVDILGRSTTLMAASMRTVQWIDDNARRLWKIKEALERRVNKFRPKSHTALDYGMFKPLARTKGGPATLGGT